VRKVKKLNPLTNTRAMLRLNPYAAVLKRAAILTAQKRQRERDLLLAEKRGVNIVFFCSSHYVLPLRNDVIMINFLTLK